MAKLVPIAAFEAGELAPWLAEMSTLEHRMEAISSQGQTLLQGLTGTATGSEA